MPVAINILFSIFTQIVDMCLAAYSYTSLLLMFVDVLAVVLMSSSTSPSRFFSPNPHHLVLLAHLDHFLIAGGISFIRRPEKTEASKGRHVFPTQPSPQPR